MKHATRDLSDLIEPGQELAQLGSGFEFTEGPTWDVVTDSLYFNDIPDDSRWRWSAERGVELVSRPNFKGNGQAFDGEGNLLVCEGLSSAVARIRPDGTREILAFDYEGKYLNSPNDLAVRSADGSIYFTDPSYGRDDDRTGLRRERDLSFQGLFRICPGGGSIELLVDEDEFLNPNGLCFSPSQDRLYVNDTDRGDIKVWDVRPDGSLENRRVIFGGASPGASGWLDGMECDEHGNLWVSAPGGIQVLAPDGDRLGIIETPEPLGSLVWGGEERRSLFLASSTSLHMLQTKVPGALLPGDGT